MRADAVLSQKEMSLDCLVEVEGDPPLVAVARYTDARVAAVLWIPTMVLPDLERVWNGWREWYSFDVEVDVLRRARSNTWVEENWTGSDVTVTRPSEDRGAELLGVSCAGWLNSPADSYSLQVGVRRSGIFCVRFREREVRLPPVHDGPLGLFIARLW